MYCEWHRYYYLELQDKIGFNRALCIVNDSRGGFYNTKNGCFNRALCIVNAEVSKERHNVDLGFNRALCTVNGDNTWQLWREGVVLIEHYVLWIKYFLNKFNKYFLVLIEHYVLWIWQHL